MTDSIDKNRKVAKDVDLGESNVFPFLEYSINISSVEIQNSLDFSYKLKKFAAAIRHTLWHFDQVLEDFDVGGLNMGKQKEVYLISTDGKKIQLKTVGLPELLGLHEKFPKRVSWLELFRLEALVKQTQNESA